MALGTFTLSERAGYMPSAPLFVDIIDIVGDSAYPTGGSAFDAKYKALKHQTRMILAVIPVDCRGFIPAYDSATGKLKFYYNDNNNAADSAGIEVPNATDLSAITFRVGVIQN